MQDTLLQIKKFLLQKKFDKNKVIGFYETVVSIIKSTIELLKLMPVSIT